MRKSRAKTNTETVAPEPARELLTKPQMLALLGDPAYSTVWGWMKDGFFPLPIELGPPNSRSTMIAWYADVVHAWIANRPRRILGKRLHEFRGRDAKRINLERSKAEIVPKAKQPRKALQQAAE